MQLVILPSEDHRRVLHEIMPKSPAALGGVNTLPISAIRWATLAITQTPGLEIQVSSQTANAQSATELKSTVIDLVHAASRMPSVREKIPNLETVMSTVTPHVDGNRVTVRLSDGDGSLKQLLSVFAIPVARAQAESYRAICSNNLKQLALAFHNYHDAHSRFPMAYSRNDKGESLLSWRVHLLPYLDAPGLYEQFHLDEPWDSEHNRTLIPKMPAVFACPESGAAADGKTTYLVPAGEDTVFGSSEGMKIKDIRDGTTNTILVVDVHPDYAVIWTKPDDLVIDGRGDPKAKLMTAHEKAFATAFCDGSVRWIPQSIPVETLRLLIDPQDGNPIPAY